MRKKCSIFWFRRDLRLDDNIGLFHALTGEYPVLPLFIFDTQILEKLSEKYDLRVQFIHNALHELKKNLKEYKSDLLVRHGDPLEVWTNLIEKYNIQSVFTNEDYGPYARQRDSQVQGLLAKHDISFSLFKDQCIFAKDEILKSDGKPYTVFTPYKNKWYQTLTPKDLSSFKNSKHFKNFMQISKLPFPSMKELEFENCKLDLEPKVIKKKLIETYHLTRNTPSIKGTSKLGVYLRFGTISIRKCAQIGYQLNRTWLDELIWREFFMQILYHFPHVVHSSFKKKYDRIKWRKSKKDFRKWCEGQTGYPLVDAGMRELNQTGFMHNRVRMLCASFLVKHLLIDWRWGEKYFAQKLLDFELSTNNGNWQWVAGTGCDAAPCFRIFNPEIQLNKFDPDFIYVKKWVPEYGTSNYPPRMIDHKFAYQRAIMAYKEALGREKKS